MKSVLFAGILLVSTQAFAQKSIECDNLVNGEVTDSMIRVSLSDNGLTIMPYEAAFTIKPNQIARRGKELIVTNALVDYSAEGEESKVKVSAIFMLSKNNGQAVLSYRIRGNAGASAYNVRLNCRTEY